MSKHTPGPWSIHGENIDGHILIGNEKLKNSTGKIAHVRYIGDNNSEEQEANAKLVAEAPEMLRTLQAIGSNIDLNLKNNTLLNKVEMQTILHIINKIIENHV